MSYGKMNTTVDIITTEPTKDAEGFVTKRDRVLATVKAYKEARGFTARWERIMSNAAFANVEAIFRFRKIPGLDVKTTHFIADSDGRYNILSAEDVRGRGMYVEAYVERLEGTVK
jgi:head-tail adaptor